MNKAELIAQIEGNGYTVLQERELGTEGNFKEWAVSGIQTSETTGDRKWFKFYERINDGACFWTDRDPFYTPTPPVTFRNQLDTFIQSKIDAGVIMAAFVEDIDEKQETAIARAVQQGAETVVEKRYFLNKDANGNPKITPLG
jgi:hypothetical protein